MTRCKRWVRVQLGRAYGNEYGYRSLPLQVFFVWKNTKDDGRRMVYAFKPSHKLTAAFSRVPGGSQAAWAACTELVTALSGAGHPFLLPSAHAEPVGYIGQRVFAQPELKPEP